MTATGATGITGFAWLLRAEWTKLRTVRGWMIGLLVAALLTVLLGLPSGAGSQITCGSPTGGSCKRGLPIGPDGEAVTDAFYFVQQPLDGDGTLTTRVTSLAGVGSAGLQPWAKAGLIVKDGTTQGSAYAAIMVTGSHGVRMQYDYTRDASGGAAAPAQWLRLTRSGDTITGYASADGTQWRRVGTAHLPGLPATVRAGMFVASPQYEQIKQNVGGGTSGTGFPTTAAARFDHVDRQGRWPSSAWSGTAVGLDPTAPRAVAPGMQENGGTFSVTGSGDIAPAVAGPEGDTPERSLVGVFAGLIAVIVVGVLFVTAEYRRGLIRLTFAASPRRGRAIGAKALVLGFVTFLVALPAVALAIWLVGRLRRSHGELILPVSSMTEFRMIVGSAALLAVSAVLALAIGTILRRSAGAVAAGVVLLVLPYVLAVASLLPTGPANWLLRVTPAAGFAVQQSIPKYHQVAAAYVPTSGYYPLAPWAGFGVLLAWTAIALAVATVLVKRRDA